MEVRPCAEAWERYRARSSDAEDLFRCLHQEGRRWLRMHAPGVKPEDQEDVLQAAQETLVKRLPQFRGTSYRELWAYFVAVLRSRMVDHLRLGALRGRVPLEEVADLADAGTPMEEAELLVDLARTLTPEEYRVVRLKLEGFGDREVGQILGKAPGTVAALYHRARGKLRKFSGGL